MKSGKQLILNSIKYNFTALTSYIEKILVGLLSLILIITLLLVFLRYVLNQSITGANEIVTILFIYTTSIGAALSTGKNEHIGIDIFVNMLPSKFHKPIRLLQIIFITLLHSVLFLYCLEWINKAGGYLMPATGLPRIVAIFSIPLGCVLCFFYCIKILIEIFNTSSSEK